MSLRLPLLQSRAPAASPAAVEQAASPRIAAPRALLCVASADAAQAPALRFACELARELATRGCAPSAVLDPGVSAGAAAALGEAGAVRVLALAQGDAPEACLQALESLPQHTLVLGVGRELAARFETLLSVAIGLQLHGADVELPAPSTAVASAVGAWLAARLRDTRQVRG